MGEDSHRRIVAGIEVESYTILLPEFTISRESAFPRKGLGEKGERFGRDWSIGTEYNSRPFHSIREGLFLLRAGLRKYNTHLYRRKSASRKSKKLFLVGGWRDRFAGAHVHLSLADERLTRERARHLSWHLHDHIPLLVAVGANSPVWADERTDRASNRILRASKLYFRPVRRHQLTSRALDEVVFSPGRKTKPATLEVRVMDANIPEYVMAGVCLLKAAALAWRAGEKAANKITHRAYLESRERAAAEGMRAHLCWNGRWLPATEYLDRFVWTFRRQLADMDIPQELWTTFKLLKRGVGGSALIAEAAGGAYEEHPQTWQRRFAKRYAAALDTLLSGDTILDFARKLKVDLPSLQDTWLGRRRLKLL
ncbi:MAG: hypothetical protein ABII00_12200 [Elusimicrobiota bacterium]